MVAVVYIHKSKSWMYFMKNVNDEKYFANFRLQKFEEMTRDLCITRVVACYIAEVLGVNLNVPCYLG
jgi:hypothetical protein